MNQPLKLWYWVRGSDFSSTCFLEASPGITFAALRKRIREESELHSPPQDVRLYRVPQTHHVNLLDDNYELVLGGLSISQLGRPLRNAQTLAAIFTSEPQENHLHLIVVPELLLECQCWRRGVASKSSFAVQISMKATVDDLKNAIKAVNNEYFGELSPSSLDLYKISAYEEAQLHDNLGSPGSGQILLGNEVMDLVFADVPFFLRPRVVVESFYETARNTTTVPSLVHPRAQYLLALARSAPMAPSEQGIPAKFSIFQSTSGRIEWTRPPGGTLSVPVTLLDPIFGRFVDECRDYEAKSEKNSCRFLDDQHNHEVESESEINSLVLELSSQMSKFFENEKERQEAFIRIFRDFGIGIMPSSSDGFITDGDLHVNDRRYMILEVKSEVGSKGAEPYCQAVLYYMNGIRNDVEKAFKEDVPFNFPCLIITLFGPHLGFSGVVWGNRPNYQVLSTVLPFFWHPTDTTMRRYAGRHICAFKNAVKTLKKRYDEFHRTPTKFKDMQPEYPHPRYYQSSDGKTCFRYIRSLQANKLLFVAETDAGERLCVKFTRTYDRTVHEQCAAWGIAPRLRGFHDDVPGGWKMVVMDFLEEYECLYDVKRDLSHGQQEKLGDELKTMLEALHQMSFVHGDVRDANVMVKTDRSGWRLVDFDWSGKIGEVRYPMNVNRGTGLKRPEGVLDGNLILAEHDMEMMSYLFR